MNAIYELNYQISMKKIILNKIGLDCFKFFLLSTVAISSIIWVLQAVNFLDIVIEDGHGFVVYLKYTFLSFPRIFNKILPFTLFFSCTYTLLKYENKNELVIFWNFGIHKKTFIHYFIGISFGFVILNLILSSIIIPTAQDKARSYIRSSNLDFLESVLKPKKFIDVIKNLTIYYEERTPEGDFKNIFLKDDKKDSTNDDNFQVTYAKKGSLEQKGGKKVLVLFDGKTITTQNGSVSQFEFSKTDFNFSQLGTKTISAIKTQENSTKNLLNCIIVLIKAKDNKEEPNKIFNFSNCRIDNLENIYKEIYGRLIIPLYCTVLVMISLFLIIKSKHDHTFKFYKLKIYIYGFLFIIFLEISLKFIGENIIQNLFFIILPLIFSMLIYIALIKNLKLKN